MRFLHFFFPILLAGCGAMGDMIQHAGEPTAKTESTTDKSIEQYQLEPYDGPKARVAVYRFADQTAKGGGTVQGGYPGYYWYNPQIGNGMADMLNDALLKSNRFIVLERQTLTDVLQEQDLAASGRVSRETGAPIGAIEGADLLIKGSVTEFEPGSAGAGAAGAAAGFFGWPGAVVGGVLGSVRQSHVAIIIQVIDAKTSRLLFSTTVEGKANDFNLGGLLGGFGGSGGGVGGLGTWQKTPVEKAIRIAILEAVKELSKKTPQTYFRHGGEGGAPSTVATLTAPSAATQPRASSASVPGGVQQIRHAQQLLKQVGLDPGLADGVAGAKTRAAIAQFQSSRMNIKSPTGRLDELTYAALKTAAAENWRYSVAQEAEEVLQKPASGELPSIVSVSVARAVLHDAPGSGGKVVTTLKQGATLVIRGEDKDCYFVVTEDGKQGWIYKSMTRK
jgi:curli biogenesis system outer membrane secretion channel CsgG